jgi:translocator protein
MNNFLKLILSIVICFIPGIAGALFTTAESSWYQNLSKPEFTPPDWLFAPVWIILYLLMGISLFLIWKEGLNNKNVRVAFTFFILQLLLNAAWAPVFFGAESITGGLIIILILWILILLTIFKAKKVSGAASNLLIPYFLWVTFASVLNFFIYILN